MRGPEPDFLVGAESSRLATRYTSWLDVFGRISIATSHEEFHDSTVSTYDIAVLDSSILHPTIEEGLDRFSACYSECSVVLIVSDSEQKEDYSTESVLEDPVERPSLIETVHQVLQIRRYESLIDRYFILLQRRDHTLQPHTLEKEITTVTDELERVVAGIDKENLDTLMCGFGGGF